MTLICPRRTITTSASNSDSCRARIVSISRSRAAPEVRAAAARSGPASRGFRVWRPRPIRQTRPPSASTRSEYSPLTSPGMTAAAPKQISPVSIRLTMVDLPIPGWPCTHTPVLLTRPSRSHSAGSRPTGSAVSMCRPIGTPGVAAPLDSANGYSPHTWALVAW